MHIQTLLKSQQDKELLYELINILFQTTNNNRLAQVVDELIRKYNLGDFFTSTQKALFWIFQHSTKNIPEISIPFFKDYIKQECRKLIVDAYEIDDYLNKIAFQDKKTTLTFLEPMALYEEESLKVVEKYIQILANEKVNRISIDVLTIEPKINFLSLNACLNHFENKLSMLLRQAIKYNIKQAQEKFIYFEVNNDTFNRTFEVLNKIIRKEEFYASKVGFSFKLDLFNNTHILEEIVSFSKILVAFGGQKMTIRLEDSNLEISTHSHFQECVYWLLKKENEPFINVVINSHNAYHLELIKVMSDKNSIENMVKIETFMGFQPLCKQCNLLYSPVVAFDDFSNGVEYLLDKLKSKQTKTIFYDFDSKNIIFFSALCHQKKSLEQILEKINLVYEKSNSLDLELLIEEELFENELFKEELFKSIESLFLCLDSNSILSFSSKRNIEIHSKEFEGLIVLRSVKSMQEAVYFVQSQTKRCAYTIYTLYKREEEQFYNAINL